MDKSTLRLVYITDWFSTLVSAAGLQSSLPPDLDSHDLWPQLRAGRAAASPRTEVVLNLDQDNVFNTWSAAIMWAHTTPFTWPHCETFMYFRDKKYKFIWGQSYLLKQRVRIAIV